MSWIFGWVTVQAVLGAFDNLWHHEWQAALPYRAGARNELALHAGREALYAILFLALAWTVPSGAWALLLGAVLIGELGLTLADFVEEDRTRQLPPLERVLHTVLTLSFGGLLTLLMPWLWVAAQAPTNVVFTHHGLWSLVLTLFAAGVGAWSIRNVRAWQRLAKAEPLQATRAFAPAAAATACADAAVLVTGATGFVGQALVARLVAEGRPVIAHSRDRRAARSLFGDAVRVIEDFTELAPETRLCGIVHLAGARVLGRTWTAARRRILWGSRVDGLQALTRCVQRLHRRPEVVVCASAVGYYGHRTTLCAETAPPEPGAFASDLCVALEASMVPLQSLGLRAVALRLGVVLGALDGAYPPQALAARLGLACRWGDGRQPMPWIHLDDAVGLVLHAIDQPNLHGPVNAVAPEGIDQRGFAHALAASFGRRCRLALPAAPLRLLLGEMSGLMLHGAAAVPARALASGYRFRWASLEAALAHLAGRAADAGSVSRFEGAAGASGSGTTAVGLCGEDGPPRPGCSPEAVGSGADVQSAACTTHH